MKLTIIHERENCTEKINFSGSKVEELLQHLKINPETVIVVRNDEVLTADEAVKNNDEIELLSVISGG
ncbi:MoaD/ThiS family protein [Candidatus Woesearchaeota archaeon]|nr:MoaD/ThiS family protein [Candidatus Woesearchaeota archaeon]